MRGRKPKPTHLKVLAGNPGKRALNEREPQPEGDLFEAPQWMTPTQAEGWRYAIDNAPAGLLRRLDRGLLTVWVVAEDIHRQATEALADGELVIIAQTSGVAMPSPYIGIATRQAQVMLKAASEMGFTPSARSRISVDQPKGADNPFAELG